MTPARIIRTVSSRAQVAATPAQVWDRIINVDITDYPHPPYFRLAGIPDPLRAEVVSAGAGGQRIAYFDNGKRFLQGITNWLPEREYGFSFNPEKGFKVLYFFDLSDGPVQIPSGSYQLASQGPLVTITLSTQYSIARSAYPALDLPVRASLKIFQRYLLGGITENVLADDRA